jgi:hypothetical protein
LKWKLAEHYGDVRRAVEKPSADRKGVTKLDCIKPEDWGMLTAITCVAMRLLAPRPQRSRTAACDRRSNTSIRGEFKKTIGSLLLHLFNRGQMSTLLSQIGY